MNKDYDPEEAARITHRNLPKELQEKFTEDDVYEILDVKYHAEKEDTQPDAGMYGKRGIDLTEEELKALFEAEKVYVRQIGGQ